MKILYKYYSDLTLDYFDEPSLKLSLPMHLNDPFESHIQNGIIKAESVFRRVLNKISKNKGEDKTDNLIMANVRIFLNSSGVISLSETQRNILMWAHYANQHHGLCIGYKGNVIETDNNKAFDIHQKLHKINYDTTRYDPINDEFNDERSLLWVSEVVKKVLTTKSDEWIYEKEHRYIQPVYECDYFISKGSLKHTEYSRHLYRTYKPTKMKKNG